MGYRALPIRQNWNPPSSRVAVTTPGGENRRDLPQLLAPQFAQIVDNYIIMGEGGLEKRKGRDLKLTVGSVASMIEEWTSDMFVLGYGTTVSVYRLSTDANTVVKANFSTNSGFKGVRYGDYFFVCNGVDKIWRISQTLAYDNQTVNFTVGNIITGGTSGATAIVLEDADAGATGTLTLGTIDGVFQNNELITSNTGGSADVNGTMTFAIAEVAASPICSVLYVFGNRLMAGNLSTDSTAVQYSSVDTGTNPPFNTWSVGILATDGGIINFRNTGTVRDIVSLGDFVIVFSEDGKWAFQITTIDSAGTLTKVEVPAMNRIDFGGDRAIVTNKGIFYVNEAGLWQLVSIGQQDVPFSEQEVVTSEILGKQYFADLDFSDADMVYDPAARIVYVTCRNSSQVNNFIFGYAIDFKAFFRISGWSIKRFLRSGKEIYGTSSVNGEMFELFEGTSDEGLAISTEYKQELNVNQLWHRSTLMGIYAQVQVDEGEEIEFHFDIYNREGSKITDAIVLKMSTSGTGGDPDGWGEAGWGDAGWGGIGGEPGLVSLFDGYRPMIRNWQRLILRITTSSNLRHTIEWVSIQTRDKGVIRRRQMEITT